MNGYNIPYDSSGKEPPAIAVGEPNPGEPIPVEPNGGPGGGGVPVPGEPIPVEPNGGPGGDVGPLYGGNPLSYLLEDLSSWFPQGDDHGGGYPPFYAAPPASGDGPYIIPAYVEASPGPGDGLDW